MGLAFQNLLCESWVLQFVLFNMSGRSQLFVGRLPLDVRERDIERIFEKYGKLLRCDVKYGTGMAYAFVDYDDRRDAEDAIRYENGREMRGQSMVVEWARGPSYRSSTYSAKSGGGLSRSAYEECYHCRRSGHWARDCPKLERDRYYPRRNRSRSRSRSRRGRSYSRSRSRSKERRSYRKRSRSYSRSRGNSKKNHSRTRSRSLSGSRSHSREHDDEKQQKNKDNGRSRSRSASKSRSPSPESTKHKSRSPSEDNVHEEKENEGQKEWYNCSRSRSHSASRSPDKSPTIHNDKDPNDDGDDAGSEQNDRQETTP